MKSCIFRYQFNGNQEKYVIGRYPEIGLKDARAQRNELAVKVSKGFSPSEERKKRRAEATSGSAADLAVRDFGERYLDEVVEKKGAPRDSKAPHTPL